MKTKPTKLYDPILEEDVLAYIFTNPHLFSTIKTSLNEESFTSALAKASYLACETLSSISNKFTNVDVFRKLTEQNKDKLIEPSEVLKFKVSSRMFNIQSACDRLNELRERRQLIFVAQEIIDRLDSNDEITSIYGQALDSLNKGITGSNAGDLKSIGELYDNVISDLNENAEQKKFGGIDTCSRALNFALGGWKTGVTIIAARPSAGKSIVLLDIAKNTAKLGKKVLFLSLEMPAEDLVFRAISSEDSEYKYSDLMNYRVTREQVDKIKKGDSALIRSLPIKFYDGNNRDVDYLSQLITKEVLGNKVEMVCIDYLQLMKCNAIRNKEDFAQVNEVSSRLQQLAKDLKIPIITLSQLSRAVESRQDKRPMMSDIRSSGNIEQDASVVIALYRPYYYAVGEARARSEPTPPMDYSLEYIILKNRNGFVGSLVRYCDVTTNRLADSEEELFRFTPEAKVIDNSVFRKINTSFDEEVNVTPF